MKASSNDDRCLDDSLPEGEWEQVWLDGVEPGVESEEASVPHKPHSGVLRCIRRTAEAITQELRGQVGSHVGAFQSQLREWIRRG